MFSDLSFEILCFADLVCHFCIPPNQIGDLQIVAKIIIYAIQAIFKSPIPKLLIPLLELITTIGRRFANRFYISTHKKYQKNLLFISKICVSLHRQICMNIYIKIVII